MNSVTAECNGKGAAGAAIPSKQLAGSVCKPLLCTWKLSTRVNTVSTPSPTAPWAPKSTWDGWCQIFIFICLLYSLAKDSSVILFVESSSVSVPAAPLSIASLQLYRNLAVSDPASTGM